MPPLTDPERLAAYMDALSNGNITGYVQFELTEEAYRWIRRELGGITLKELARLMHVHVAAGGTIDEVKETRPEWCELHEFHHDLRLSIDDKAVYVETRLLTYIAGFRSFATNRGLWWSMSMPVSPPNDVKRPTGADRPLPWRCRHCGKKAVFMATVHYDAEVCHDGRLYNFTIPALTVPACQSCGEKVFTEAVDDQINAALREHLHLLKPEDIRAALVRVQMTPQEAAERLGIAETTLSRWLDATQIQSRALDNLLRIFFAFPEVRSALNGDRHDPHLGSADLSGQALAAPASTPPA